MREVSETLEDLKDTRDTIQQANLHLRNRNPKAAKHAVDGMAAASDCETCEKVELELATLIQTVELAPRPRVEDRLAYVQQEVGWLISRYDAKIEEGQQKLAQMQAEQEDA